MCGIIGFNGNIKAMPILLNGLFSLEYRGYDSAGVSISEKNNILTIKCRGRVKELKSLCENYNCIGTCGIGHTRWATHGGPSDVNAHPHNSACCSVVHNGIIENHSYLKDFLIKEGYIFKSDTDTECVAHLIDYEYRKCKEPYKSLLLVKKEIEGSYALAVLFKDYPDELWLIKKDNPLIIAKNRSGMYVASDVHTVSSFSDDICRISDDQIICLHKESYDAFDLDFNKIKLYWDKVIKKDVNLDLGEFDHYMLKEIYEQPSAVYNAVSPLLTKDCLPDYEALGYDRDFLKGIECISVIGCGSAANVGLVSKHWVESLCNIPCVVTIASEYRYSPPIINGRSLTILISQSGETADTLAALKIAKENGAETLGIINVEGSAIAMKSDNVIYTNAGPEIAVATTKGYISQLSVLFVLSVATALSKNAITKDRAIDLCKELLQGVPKKIKEILNNKDSIVELSEKIYKYNNMFFIGRGIDYSACVEGSLKLKEVSYIHSEAYSAGELKHGTLALVTDKTPVISICTDEKFYGKMLSNVREVSARKGKVIIVGSKEFVKYCDECDAFFEVPNCESILSPFLSVVSAQLLAYNVAIMRECDVDHPRNLAKSVTVE